MANISVADGTIELSRKFYDENKALINNWVNDDYRNWKDGNFGFDYLEIKEKTEEKVVISFSGEGAWCWEYTLKDIFKCEQATTYQEKLVQKLYEERQSLYLKYTDIEDMEGMFVEEETEVKINKVNDRYEPVVTVVKQNQIEFTDYNRIKAGVEDGYRLDVEEDVKYLKQDLQELYQENKDDIEEKDYESFEKNALKYIKEDYDLHGGICLYKLEDPYMFLEQLEY